MMLGTPMGLSLSSPTQIASDPVGPESVAWPTSAVVDTDQSDPGLGSSAEILSFQKGRPDHIPDEAYPAFRNIVANLEYSNNLVQIIILIKCS